ncbi:MAG: ribosomal protein L7/L12 [Prevotella sp.]|nr:ribosomal protein L7/L12 [Prevotella sp.]
MAEALDLVNSAPCTLVENVTEAQAEAFAQKLRNAGATVTVYINDIEINEANFPDANFRNWLLAQTYGADGILTPEEIAAVTSINVSDKSIADLTGIEHFTALTYLACTSNQLTSLDVSGCTALKYLYCFSNQLTSLDVSGCTALTLLSCNSNQLTSLDVSKNTALWTLYCYSNQIKGNKMLALVNGLRGLPADGTFCAIDTKNSSEQNVITKSQVAIATGNRWRVYDRNGGSNIEYAGSDDPFDLNGDGVIDGKDARKIKDVYLNQE